MPPTTARRAGSPAPGPRPPAPASRRAAQPRSDLAAHRARAPGQPGRRSSPAPSPHDETIGGQAWTYDSGIGKIEPRSATRVLSTLAGKVAQGDVTQYQPVPLGFTPLDKSIGGGMRAGEMLLIGGAQGTGKTTMALQMARNIVMSGLASVLYICFEHDEEYLLNRLIAQESVLPSLPTAR